MNETRVYVAGPMSGLPGYNLPAFSNAAERLNAAGYVAVNPGAPGVIPGYQWSDYMRDALALLVTCDALAYLPGSSTSRGARMELRIARELGMRVAPLHVYLEEGVSE